MIKEFFVGAEKVRVNVVEVDPTEGVERLTELAKSAEPGQVAAIIARYLGLDLSTLVAEVESRLEQAEPAK